MDGDTESWIDDEIPALPILPSVMTDLMLQRSCVAFVGAGFSMACGMPGWEGLMRILVNYGAQWLPSGTFGQVEELLDAKDLPMAAALLREIMAPAQINDCLNDTFGPAALQRATSTQQRRMRTRMKSLVDSGWAGIVTTNFDALIEQALWKQADGADWLSDIQIDGDPSRLCEVLVRAREDRLFYVKLHGSLSGSGIVLSTEEYDRAYLRSPQVSTFLQALMLQYHLVFIGCSLEDELVRIRRKLTGDFGGLIPRAFAIMPRTSRNEARMKFLRMSASIDPIWYSADDPEHSGVDEMLAAFSKLPKPPEDFRNLLRFRSLADRFAHVTIRNKRLLAYIATQPERSVDLKYLLQEVAEDALLREDVSTGDIEDELRHRLLFLMAIGLLWEEKTPNKTKFAVPKGLSDDLLRKHGAVPPKGSSSSAV